jgi:hypothetical protein
MRSSSAVALLAGLLAGCNGGDSGERQVFNQLHTACDQISLGNTTVAAAIASLNVPFKTAFTRDLACPTNLVAVPGRPDQCQYGTRTAPQPVCRVALEWEAFDNDLCNFNGGGCFYFCELRTQGQPGQSSTDTTATVCGTDWESGQPFL